MGCEPAPDSGRRPGPMQLGTDAGRRPWPPVDPLWSLLFQVGFAASASLPRLSADRARRGVSTERGVEMVPCSSKVRFRAARCRAVLTRMLVVVGFALGVGLAAGAAPALVITPCAPGSYSSTGNQPCTPAPPGSFVASPGATSATPCRAGTVQPGRRKMREERGSCRGWVFRGTSRGVSSAVAASDGVGDPVVVQLQEVVGRCHQP